MAINHFNIFGVADMLNDSSNKGNDLVATLYICPWFVL